MRILLILFAIVTVCLSRDRSACAQPAPSQAVDAETIEKALAENRIKPETEELQTACDDLRAHLKLMREKILRHNVSSLEDGDRYRREFLGMVEKGYRLHANMIDAAFKEFQLNNANHEKLAAMLARYVERQVEMDRYENLLEIAVTLYEEGYPDPELPHHIAMTSLATNEFDVADEFLAKLVAMGEQNAHFATMREALPEMRKNWQEELALREQDAEGEPLPRVLMHTTKGDVELELFENQAPETVANFIYLIEKGFYDGLTFHRVLEHFAAQGGCPIGDGSGDDGYQIYGESHKPNSRRFFRGSIGMALAGDNVDTGGSQFFITFMPAPELDEKFTTFGRVINGLNVISSLRRKDPDEKKEDKSTDPTDLPDEVLSIEILFKRAHDYQPNRVTR